MIDTLNSCKNCVEKILQNVMFNICTISVICVKWNEKMAFPTQFPNSAYPELLLKGPSFDVAEGRFPDSLIMQTC